MENKILAKCNTRCNCLTKTWDPVCGDNGIAYMSACLAGCEKSVGTGINMVNIFSVLEANVLFTALICAMI